MKPTSATLHLAAKDWLVSSGTPTLGAHDAPRATADFDIDVNADLTAPIVTVDATVNSLALNAPDRLDRAHQPEWVSPGGDVIFVEGNATVGKLPYVAPALPAEAKPRRPIDARIHIPRPIHLMQVPLDVMAHGDITVTVRDEGVKTRGGLTMDSGTLSLFGKDHELVEGSLTFTDDHPSGWLSVTFEHALPDAKMREIAATAGTAQITLTGVPGKQKTTLHGSANGAMFEVMAMYNAGRPLYITQPGLPASTTTQVPRGDQLFILTFMASNLPHLLFLDRFAAWADPYVSPDAYGRIQNMEADKYGDHTRIRALVRPPTPGRSSAELQYDRLFFDDNRRAFGIGLRGGDRGGGGLGLFYEWSSSE
jgi:translocation-and-assembly-module (TAM) inner membrane subunit TamB-like protein